MRYHRPNPNERNTCSAATAVQCQRDRADAVFGAAWLAGRLVRDDVRERQRDSNRSGFNFTRPPRGPTAPRRVVCWRREYVRGGAPSILRARGWRARTNGKNLIRPRSKWTSWAGGATTPDGIMHSLTYLAGELHEVLGAAVLVQLAHARVRRQGAAHMVVHMVVHGLGVALQEERHGVRERGRG